MLPSTDLAAALLTLPQRPYEHHAFRVVDNKYLAADPPLHPLRYLYGLGAPRGGARFTPPGGAEAIYLAADLQTAFDEANPVQAIVRRKDPGLVGPTDPGGFVSVRYRLERVLDVTDRDVQQALGTSRAELQGTWRQARNRGRTAPTQELGQSVYESGRFQAIWYESRLRPGTFCLAVFTDRLVGTDSFLEVHDSNGIVRERLP